MIEVKKDYSTIPTGLCDDGHRAILLKVIAEKENHKFTSLYKDKSKHELKALYFEKCGYCECNGSSGYYIQVDHYRPKKGKPADGHTGYYWLGYEWTNLILCCNKCNDKKLAKFPIKGKRIEHPDLSAEGLPESHHLIASSAELLNEDPLLLNPEIDKPADHITLLPNGELLGVTDRGRETIEICDLNRQKLVLDRKDKIVKFFNPIKQYFYEYNLGNVGEEELKRNIERHLNFLFERYSPKAQYSMVWKWMWYKFEIYAKHYLENDIATASIRYYIEFVDMLETNRIQS